MSIVQPAPPFDIHAVVRSEDGPVIVAPRSSAELAARRPVSRVEPVPGYKRRIGAKTAQPPATVVELSTVFASRGRAVSASVASFGTVDHAEVVIGDDDRAVVPDPTELPWRHICALRITSASGKEYVGTGWFIGPRTVMTAGHCVYLHDDGGWPKSIAIVPALNGNVEPYGDQTANRFRATQGWIESRDTNADYGVIQLDDDSAGSAAGWFAFAAYEDTQLLANDANIAGYPYDLDRATRQYFHARRVTSASPFKLFYDIDTYGGQSGSPVWFDIEGKRVAIGVHTTGSSTSNSGTRITAEVFRNMELWRDEFIGSSVAPLGPALARR